MYNRYVSQSDGTYQRSWVSDPPPQRTPARHEPPPKPAPAPPPCPPPPPAPCAPEPPRHPSAGSFLRQLLPKNMDTGDLIVVLLLLLMAGDSEEHRSNALLTLALYFIM